MLDSILQVFLQLPVGLLFAAILMEGFILWKDRREVEPAVLWLLCCAAVTGVLCAAVHYLLKGNLDYALWVGLGSALTAIGFWFKRQMRNRGILRLKDRFYAPNSYAAVKIPGQTSFVMGFRGSVIGGLALALVGLFLGGVLDGTGLNASAKFAELTAGTKPPSSEPPAAAAPGAPAPTPPAPTVAATIPPPAAPGNPAEAAPPVVSVTPPAEAPAAPVPTPAPSEVPPSPPPAESTPGTTAQTPPAPVSPPAPTITPSAPSPVANPAAPPAPAPPAAPAMSTDNRPVSRNSIFAQRIMPILRRACVECHGSSKQKGDCRLDTPAFIRGDGGGKPMVYAGKPDKSPLYMVIAKPADDDDRMPPAKKGPPLPRPEIELIRKWIEAGADMGDGVSASSSGPVKFVTDHLAANLAVPDPALLEQLKAEFVNVRVLKDGKFVELDFSHTDYPVGGIKLERLAPLCRNVNSLDLSRTRISDQDLAHVATMTNLTRLLLSRTEIGDGGLVHLKGLSQLEYLNLYQTKVTDAGLSHLSGMTNLKKLYAWQSGITSGGAASLTSRIPGLAVNVGEQ